MERIRETAVVLTNNRSTNTSRPHPLPLSRKSGEGRVETGGIGETGVLLTNNRSGMVRVESGVSRGEREEGRNWKNDHGVDQHQRDPRWASTPYSVLITPPTDTDPQSPIPNP